MRELWNPVPSKEWKKGIRSTKLFEEIKYEGSSYLGELNSRQRVLRRLGTTSSLLRRRLKVFRRLGVEQGEDNWQLQNRHQSIYEKYQSKRKP